jgi:hypothetical protein
MVPQDEPHPVSALPLLESSLLWAIRAWAIGCRRGVSVEDRLARLFDGLRAPLALGYLNGLMWALNGGATRMLDVNCVCHDAVSDDEALLLDVLALQQAHRDADARALLGRITTRGAARVGAQSAAGLVESLRAAGHRLPREDAALRRHAMVAAHADFGMAGLPMQ